MTALLTVQGLHAGYGAIRALRGCSLEVAKGETVAVVGANGAGKTTLMRAISGMIGATAGRVTFDGTPIDGWPPHRLVGRGLLHVPEGRGTILGLTVEDNLRLVHAGAATREPFDAAAARAYARFPGLRERRAQRAGNLSGGEQQMLALSRAIMAPPRLLLVDEPSLGLSPVATGEVFAALAEFKAAGMGMLIVEQNVRRTLRIADRAHVLRQGVFVASGTGAELLTDPALLTGYLGAHAFATGDRMRDVLGYRHKFGVLGPSTNTVVQPDFDDMRPVGVTNHYSRIFTPNADAVSDDTFMAGARLIGRNTVDAVASVMTSGPDSLVMGMSAVTFFGGMAGADAFQKEIEDASGLRATVGSHASAAALRAYGGVRRVAFLSPYFPAANAEGAALPDGGRVRYRARPVPAMSELDRHRRHPAGAPAHGVARTGWRGRGRHLAGRHQSQHGTARRGGRDVAWQAGGGDQHGNLLARAARRGDWGQGSRGSGRLLEEF